jgi:hypothetical protein
MFINPMNSVLHIGPNRLISEIQEEFNTAFPYLKIEFFNTKTFSRSDFSARQLIPHNRRLGDNQLNTIKGNIEIELEQLFKNQFSLAVQVFRKSGNLWLETTMTDSWTLQQQNNHGKEISTGKVKDDTAEDFDLIRDAD